MASSSAEAPPRQSPRDAAIVPLQPVQVGDHHGLSAALYSINALRHRAGDPALDLSSVRPRVASLIRAADAARLALLLQEWYHEAVDDVDTDALVRNLPGMIEGNDDARYNHNPIVNDIEWSALATIFRCCVAVKFLSPRNAPKDEARNRPGWKIAVPVPKIFGLPPAQGDSPAPGTSCVFLVCHSSRTLTTYVPLIPIDQEIFAPGRSLLGRARSQIPSSAPQPSIAPSTHKKLESTAVASDSKVDVGDNPGIHFEGYRLEQPDPSTQKEKRVTFAEPVSDEEASAAAVSVESVRAESGALNAEPQTANDKLSAETAPLQRDNLDGSVDKPDITSEDGTSESKRAPESEAQTAHINEKTINTEEVPPTPAPAESQRAEKETEGTVGSSVDKEKEAEPGSDAATESDRMSEESVGPTPTSNVVGKDVKAVEGAPDGDASVQKSSAVTQTDELGSPLGNPLEEETHSTTSLSAAKKSAEFVPPAQKEEPETAEEESPIATLMAEKANFVPKENGGRIELEIGELSEATVLFQRVYGGGSARETSPMHGKLSQKAESMDDIIRRMQNAVH